MKNIIEVKNLTKSFKEITAVNDVSFSVDEGELFGYLGENGAGKSTTINMLCSILAATSGDVSICGLKLGKDDKEIRKRIGVVFQSNTLDDNLTVYENLVVRGHFYTNSSKEVKKNLDLVNDILQVGDLMKSKFKTLSGGQKRRCEIARALMNEPEVLFLDEPTTGLDPMTRKIVWESISKLQKEKKMTIFLTTHYMEEAARANHIAIMDRGKIVAFGTPQKLKEQFAHDKIKAVVNDEEKFNRLTKEMNLITNKHSNYTSIRLNNTMDSLEILPKIKDYISGFEVIQGTMDDVFLNCIGKTKKEELQ